jgi:hypothetical protein
MTIAASVVSVMGVLIELERDLSAMRVETAPL